MSLYNDYLKMIDDAGSFMKVHKVRMSGEDIRPGTKALVITKESLDTFTRKLREIESKKETETEKERLINYALDMSRKSDNPYDIPEQSSSSDDAAFYFPFGRE